MQDPGLPLFDRPVRLLMHRREAMTLGGPSLRVPQTAEALRRIGAQASASSYDPAEIPPEEIVHLFNLWEPSTCLAAMSGLKRAGKTIVFSPIYLDLHLMPYWQHEVPKLDLTDLDQLAQSSRAAEAQLTGPIEPMPHFHRMVRDILGLADHVIFLSQAERQALAAIGAEVPEARASLVHNPVEAALWGRADPGLFRAAYLADLPGPRDYVLSVGRIEPRKNQLLLARAIRDLPLHLVLVGHSGDEAYAARLMAEFGGRITLPGRLDPGSEMLRSALAGAKAFALPSWAEGASLAVLEAAASGAALVLSDRSSEAEYFGDLARYCDPGDPRSIQAALAEVLADPAPRARASALQTLVSKNYSWEVYAKATAQAYAAAEARKEAEHLAQTGGTPCLALGDWGSAGVAAPRFGLSFDAGWHLPEADRRITAKDEARLSLRLAPQIRQQAEDIYLLLRQDGCFARETRNDYRVSLAGETLYQATVSQADFPVELLLRLPAGSLSQTEALDLQLRFPVSRPLAAVSRARPSKQDAFAESGAERGGDPSKHEVQHLSGATDQQDQADSSGVNSKGGEGLALHAAALLVLGQTKASYLFDADRGWFDGRRPAMIDLCRTEHRALICPAAAYRPGWGALCADGLVLTVPLLPHAPAQSLTLRLRTRAAPGARLSLRATWGGREILVESFDTSATFELSCQLTREDIRPFAPGRLELWAETASGPANVLRAKTDIGLLSLAFQPWQDGEQ